MKSNCKFLQNWDIDPSLKNNEVTEKIWPMSGSVALILQARAAQDMNSYP